MASLKDVKAFFETVNTANIDQFIKTLKTLLKGDKPGNTPRKWGHCVESGYKILSHANEKGKSSEMVDLFISGSDILDFASGILKEVGKAHSILIGLSMIGRLLTKAVQMAKNQDDCLHLLKTMVDLAEHINNLSNLGEGKEKLANALAIIVKGSMLCAKQLYSERKFFRFLKSSLDANNLRSLHSEITALYPDLLLTAVIAVIQHLPDELSVIQPKRPAEAVGLKDREQKVVEMLKMSKMDKKLRAVVIYGIGGIGKTFLANSVCSRVDRIRYNFCKIVMDPEKTDIKRKQEQILKDAFPNYRSGRRVDLRDTEEGKLRLTEAFQKAIKPAFLFIDNVLRAKELKELLPENLERPGKDIRILLTARDLGVPKKFKKNFFLEYLVKPLPNNDAKKLLSNEKDVDRILKVCKGIPRALKIVDAEFEKRNAILNYLETGKEMKDLTEDMVGFVFRGFDEYMKEAFLDICCFFDGVSRALVESSVGSGELKGLQDAALITIEQETGPMHENEETVVVHRVIKARGQNMAQSTRIRGIQAFEKAVVEKRLNEIKGIELEFDKGHSSYVLRTDHLDLMSESLRVLKLRENIRVSSKSKMRFAELKYVHLNHKIPFAPFNSENLPKLAVYIGPLLTGGDSIYKLPKSLVLINAFQPDGKSRNWDRVAPNSSLQKLYLRSFSMKTFPQGLDGFRALRTLMLDDWKDMGKLPEVICGLNWLRRLYLVKCGFRHLPDSFGGLKALTHLSLQSCDQLQDLPSTMGKLKGLRYFNLEGCTSLKKLPPTFGELVALQGLNLKECARLKEIPGFEMMKKLKYMNIQGCPELKKLRSLKATTKGLRIEK